MVLLEARVRDFEKRMAQAERRGSKTFGQLRRNCASATRAMEADMGRASGRINQALAAGGPKLRAVGKAWAVGLVGGIAAASLSGIVSQVAQVANGVARVGDEARRAKASR